MIDFLKDYILKESTLAEWFGITVTMLLGVLAIFGEQTRKWIFRPRLAVLRVVKTTQSIGVGSYIYQRLIVKNIGLRAARDVRILLSYKNELPINFIPIPLGWTHWSGAKRDISIREPAYVDVFFKQDSSNKYDFCWPFETGLPNEEILKRFKPEYGEIRLEFYELDRIICDVTLKYLVDRDEFIIVK